MKNKYEFDSRKRSGKHSQYPVLTALSYLSTKRTLLSERATYFLALCRAVFCHFQENHLVLPMIPNNVRYTSSSKYNVG